MDLLEKFGQVEVKADNRISEYDRCFCQVNQTAYEKAREFIKRMAEEVDKAQVEQYSILKAYNKDSPSFLGSGYHNEFDPEVFWNRLDKTHDCFIARLVSYFAHQYNVSLDDEVICKSLIPQKPKDPDYSIYGWRRNLSAEQEAALDKLSADHKAAMAEYTSNLRSLSLTYTDVLDQIFVQLGGYSFQDKAVRELKDAAHKHAWNTYHGTKNYEVKKATISFSSSCYTYSWGHGEMQLHDGMKDVVRALAYFEFGTQDYLGGGFSELRGYTFKGNSFECGWEKIKQIRCFKNGRVDVKFTSEAYARQFVEDYLGTEV